MLRADHMLGLLGVLGAYPAHLPPLLVVGPLSTRDWLAEAAPHLRLRYTFAHCQELNWPGKPRCEGERGIGPCYNLAGAGTITVRCCPATHLHTSYPHPPTIPIRLRRPLGAAAAGGASGAGVVRVGAGAPLLRRLWAGPGPPRRLAGAVLGGYPALRPAGAGGAWVGHGFSASHSPRQSLFAAYAYSWSLGSNQPGVVCCGQGLSSSLIGYLSWACCWAAAVPPPHRRVAAPRC